MTKMISLNISTTIHLFFFLCVGSWMISTSSVQATVSAKDSGSCSCDRAQDSLSLVQLYEATNGKGWRTKWDLKIPVDQWYGVHLNEQGCVRCLDLDGKADCTTRSGRGNGLKGPLPDLQLPHLKYLLLASNQLNGELPDFSGLPSLRILRLSCNQLSGLIPDFHHTPSLKSLELDYNQLSGSLPDFQHLPNIESLYVLANQLSDQLPEFTKLPKLQYFIASRNQFEGPLPGFYQSPELKLLLINENQLTGELPDLIHLYNLKSINLSKNQLSGTLFDWSALTDLEAIILSGNEFSGTIPELASLAQLKILDLSNNEIEGEIPDFSNLQNLQTVVLSNNNLKSCSTPKNIPALINYDVRENYLKLQDLQPNTELLKEPLKYSPQRYEGVDSLFVLKAASNFILQLPEALRSEGSWYTWYKDGEVLEENEDQSSFSLQNFSDEMAGSYYCKVSHPALPELEFRSPMKIIQLESIDPISTDWAFEEIKASNQAASLNEKNDDINPFQIPGGITPNGDGINDFFEIKAIEDKEEFGQVELMIFSASGQLVFHTKPYRNNWNGSLQNSGKALPDGIYFYALQTESAKFPVHSGSLTVFR